MCDERFQRGLANGQGAAHQGKAGQRVRVYRKGGRINLTKGAFRTIKTEIPLLFREPDQTTRPRVA